MVHRKGFTLIELLVVVSIIGILSTLATVSLNSTRVKARDVRRLSDLSQFKTALELYYIDIGSYPSAATLQTLGTGNYQALSAAGFTNTAGVSGAPYMVTIPRDPLSTSSYLYCSTDGAGACAAYLPGGSYKILATLEGLAGGFSAGGITLTPNGLTQP